MGSEATGRAAALCVSDAASAAESVLRNPSIESSLIAVTFPLTNPTRQPVWDDSSLAAGHALHSCSLSADEERGKTVVGDSIFPPRLNRSKTKPPIGGVIPWIAPIVLSVASGNTIAALSALLPTDTSITGPAPISQFVLLDGPRENTGGRVLTESARLRRFSRHPTKRKGRSMHPRIVRLSVISIICPSHLAASRVRTRCYVRIRIGVLDPQV
jgi:hypothetical protein